MTQVDCIKRDFRRVINNHSHGLDELKEVFAGLDRTTGAVGEVVNAPFEVLARLNPVLLPTPPSIVISVQTTNSYANRLAITATLDRLTTNCLQYEAVLDLEELVGAAEHLYILYP